MYDAIRCKNCGVPISRDDRGEDGFCGSCRHAKAQNPRSPGGLAGGEASINIVLAQKAALGEQLAEVCNRLWPYVRIFGLCGADLNAVQAVQDLGVLLNKVPASAASLSEQAGREAIHQITTWLRDHRFTGRHIKRSAMDTLLRELTEEFTRSG